MEKRDYYEVLGVNRTATLDQIKSAHRRLARKFHPDVNKSDPQAPDKFKEVQEAYDVLSDPQQRANYDQFGHAGVGTGQPSPNGSADPFAAFRRGQAAGRGQRSWQAGPDVSVEDLEGGGGGFGDIFEQFFGRGARAGRGRPVAEPQRGQDIEHPVTLSFEQAARGTKLPLQINREGRIETIEIKVPSGVRDGSRVRIRGQGQQTGGQPGDLYIVTRVLPHAYFRRDGLDISVDVPISLYEAIKGARVDVPTLDGRVTLTIPPCTSGGSRLRIKGQGIERGGQRGDEFAVLRIIVPKSTDADDLKMLDTLEQKHPVAARANVPW